MHNKTTSGFYIATGELIKSNRVRKRLSLFLSLCFLCVFGLLFLNANFCYFKLSTWVLPHIRPHAKGTIWKKGEAATDGTFSRLGLTSNNAWEAIAIETEESTVSGRLLFSRHCLCFADAFHALCFSFAEFGLTRPHSTTRETLSKPNLSSSSIPQNESISRWNSCRQIPCCGKVLRQG